MATALKQTVRVQEPQAQRTPLPAKFIIYPALILIAFIALAPFVWMILTSLKDYGDVISLKFWPWPPLGDSKPAWGNFERAIQIIGNDNTGLDFLGITFFKDGSLFLRQFFNTVFVTLVVVMGVVVTSCMAAYAFAQLQFPGKSILFIIVLATLMIPDDLTLVPRAVMMNKSYLNWYDSYKALTIPFLASAFGIFMLRQFFMQIPKDLFDAARIDGAGHIRYLWQVMVPLARPAILSVALFNFIWTWNEFKWTQLVTRDTNMRTFSVSLQSFLQGEGGAETQLAMAVALMVVIPVIVIYFFTQKYFTEGIATTGLKG